MNKLKETLSISLGADPEFFIRRQGEVVGSEGVISGRGGVIVDGVQAELNPEPKDSIEGFKDSVIRCFKTVNKEVAGEYTADFARTVTVGSKAFKALTDDSKKFGCKPSYNAVDGLESFIGVDPAVYMVRSAGGHIHLGKTDERTEAVLEQHTRIIRLLDVVLGNTCVMLDTDKGNAERRKNYGRAGEYRVPKYGVEYRTLSNFWLGSYQLMSLVMGLARHAVELVDRDVDTKLMSMVDYDEVVKAINNNDKKLARKNWDKIKDYLVAQELEGDHPITPANLEAFDTFTSKDMSKVFKQPVVEHWTDQMDNKEGFSEFLNTYDK